MDIDLVAINRLLRLKAMNGTPENPEVTPHIGIVGAGISGLRCADVLLRHGFQVTILEGRNRIGGRICQANLPNGPSVDLGPNWIHGTKDNPIMDLAKATKTIVGAWDTKACIYGDDGNVLPLEDGERCSAIMWSIIEDAFAHSSKNCIQIESKLSLMDFFRQKVVEKIPDTIEGWEKERHIVLQMAELWGAYVGSSVYNQSLKFFWLEECIDGENLFCAGTYQNILEEVARPAVERGRIIVETKVSKISSKSATIGKVVAGTSDGRNFVFDELVVTAPLGWLQKNLDVFKPRLPLALCASIKNIGYGCLEKVYITFRKAFWLVPGPDGRIAQGFAQWLSPKYDPQSNPERWSNEMVEIASLPPPVAHPTLLFYLYGDESQFITSQVRSLVAEGKSPDAFLLSFFKPYYSRLPSYDENDPDCRPTGCLSTDWLGDELAGNGSYSNYQVGLEAGDQDIVTIRTGVPDEGLWFAGEHTSPFVAMGTATGAYWSGEHTARKIMNKYDKACG